MLYYIRLDFDEKERFLQKVQDFHRFVVFKDVFKLLIW